MKKITKAEIAKNILLNKVCETCKFYSNSKFCRRSDVKVQENYTCNYWEKNRFGTETLSKLEINMLFYNISNETIEDIEVLEDVETLDNTEENK